MARQLNGNAPRSFIRRRRVNVIQSSSHDSPHPTAGAATRRPPVPPNAAALAIVLTGAACLLPSALALAQSGALAGIQAQIQRYGCHLPQYATSVEGCRQLHARARALAAQPAAPSPDPAPSPAQRTPAYRSPAYPPPAYAPPQPRRGGLFSLLFGAPGPSYYRRRPGSSPDSDYFFSPAPQYRSGTYRTLCVRLCDGYYWPISYSTIRARLGQDASQCESSCQSPAKLFYHYNPGGSVENMVDLEGNPYSRLPNAFRYRSELVKDCRCKPEPWSEAAKKEYERRGQLQEEQPETPSADAGDAAKPEPNPGARPLPTPARARPARPPRQPGVLDNIIPFGRWSAGAG